MKLPLSREELDAVGSFDHPLDGQNCEKVFQQARLAIALQSRLATLEAIVKAADLIVEDVSNLIRSIRAFGHEYETDDLEESIAAYRQAKEVKG